MANYSSSATVTLEVNGRQAQNILTQLRGQASLLQKQLSQATSVGDKEKAKQLQKQLNDVNGILRRMQTETSAASDVMQRLDSASMKELQKTLNTLRNQLRKLPRDTQEYIDKLEEVKRVQASLTEARDMMKPDKSWKDEISSFFDSRLTRVTSIAALASGIGKVMQTSVENYVELDAELANTQKFTGMAREEVEQLNEELRKMETPTSSIDLLKLAEEAGRLGKNTVEDVAGYVRAADIINVSLDELGEGATQTISKLTGVFGIEEEYGTEQSLLKVGSVVNDLAQSCSASSPYIVDFTARMGGVGKQARISVSDIMAYGAVFDTLGMNVEASSTALAKVITHLFQDPAKYARTAGLDVKQFTDLLRTDANAALMEFLGALNRAGDFSTLAPMFADMGEKGSGVVNALSSLAGHLDEVKTKQAEAAQAFEEGTSVIEEYNVQSSTAEAQLAMVKKEFWDMSTALGKSLTPAYLAAAKAGLSLVTGLRDTISFITQNKTLLLTLVGLWGTYALKVNAAAVTTALFTAAEKGKNAAMTAGRAVMATVQALYYLCALGLATLTGNTQAATAAQLGLNAAMSANPVGAVVTLILSAVAALALYNKTANETAGLQDRLADATERAVKARAKEEQVLASYISRIESFNGTKEEEQRLVNELNSKYGGMFRTYDTLAQWLQVLKKRGKEYCDTVYNQILAEGKLEAARQLIADAARRRAEAKNADPGWWNTFSSTINNYGGKFKFRSWNEAAEDYRNYVIIPQAEADAAAMEAEAHRLSNEAIAEKEAADKKLGITSGQEEEEVVPGSGGSGGSGGGSKGSSRHHVSAAERRRKQIEAAKALHKAEFEKVSQTRDTQLALLLRQRESGALGYLDYIEQVKKAEDDFYADTLKIYENAKITDDSSYEKLKKERDTRKEKHEQEIVRVKKASIDAMAAREKALENLEYEKKPKDYQESLDHEDRLFDIRKRQIEQTMELYSKGSREYADLEEKLADETFNHRLAKEKILYERFAKIREAYQKELSDVERFNVEKAVLDAMKAQGKVSEKEYGEILAKMKEGVVEALPATDKREAAIKKFEADSARLKEALDAELLTQEEYNKRMKQLKKEFDASMKQDSSGGGRSFGGGQGWASQFLTVYESWDKFAKVMKDPKGAGAAGVVSAIGEAMSATVGMMTTMMEQSTQLVQMESQRQVALIEKRYDKEKTLAEGNTFLEKRLEREKTDAISRMKTEAARKQFAMQVISTVAQTAVNAVSAYGAALQTGPAGLVLAPIAAALAAAQGAVQVALLKKQQQMADATGYMEGGFTQPGPKERPAGVVHAGEWVAPARLLRSPETRPLVDILEYARVNNRLPALTREDVSRSLRAPALSAARTSAGLSALAEAQRESAASGVSGSAPGASAESGVLDRLARRLEEPIVATVTVAGNRGVRKALDDYDRLLANKSRKRRNDTDN